MTWRRTYLPHRQAYAPRVWPVLIPASAWGFACVAIPVPGYVGFPVGVAVGYGYVEIRWAIWKRRHPVMTKTEYMKRMRETAPWN